MIGIGDCAKLLIDNGDGVTDIVNETDEPFDDVTLMVIKRNQQAAYSGVHPARRAHKNQAALPLSTQFKFDSWGLLEWAQP